MFIKKRTLPLTKNRKDSWRKILPICAASIQQRIVSILLNKLKKAAIQTGVKEICIAGGVSANSGLRTAFQKTGEKYQLEHIHTRFSILHRQRCHDRHYRLL